MKIVIAVDKHASYVIDSGDSREGLELLVRQRLSLNLDTVLAMLEQGKLIFNPGLLMMSLETKKAIHRRGAAMLSSSPR